AVNRINDEGVLADLAKNSQHWSVRETASQRTSDVEVLNYLVEYDSFSSVKKAARSRLDELQSDSTTNKKMTSAKNMETASATSSEPDVWGSIDMQLRDKEETRTFSDFSRANEVKSLCQTDPEKAIDICEEWLEQMPDFDVPCLWIANAMVSSGEKKIAHDILLNAVKFCRRKCLLCTKLGELYLDESDALPMVIWMANAVITQKKSPNYHTPYLYLGEVCIGCLLEDLAAKVRRISKTLAPSHDLSPEAKNRIRRLVNPDRELIVPILHKIDELGCFEGL
ncbi:MAG: hypothetical protein JRF37_04205, partial [Deltaproteobacteria bacterium]|nr:hypothetical protein [Deltaproteobacteria bacterium]